MGAVDYVRKETVSNFRKAWEDLDVDTEIADDYGLGSRDSLQEAVETVISILGMQVGNVDSLSLCLPRFASLWGGSCMTHLSGASRIVA